MPLTLLRNDITKLPVDAIVNAANTGLRKGGGVCGAIFGAAGAERLQAACDRLAPIKTGEAVITEGFMLPAKYIIHVAGPVYRGGKHGEEGLLRACYLNALELALQHNCESIAFPLISSGIYGYPKAEALRVATAAISDFISEHDINVSLVLFDKASFAISQQLLGDVESYIEDRYVDEHLALRRKLSDAELKDFAFAETEAEVEVELEVDDLDLTKLREESLEFLEPVAEKAPIASPASPQGSLAPGTDLDSLVSNLDEPFAAMLLRLIDATGKKDAEIYRRANIDRRLFSKIRGNANYAPSKPTVLAFAVALELTLEQTADLLGRAGFALSPSRKFDVIVEFFIANRKYNIFQINEVLFSYDQPLLGGSL
ncbi:MAG: macro domain-containing protein [Firmicutes bacterium]|nr:macro domain-containing protein [Bacillota bacterium]